MELLLQKYFFLQCYLLLWVKNQYMYGSLNRLEQLWREFTDVPYGVSPQDVFGEEMNNLRTNRKEVMEKLLKLKVE